AIAASFWANGIASGGPYVGEEAIFSTNALHVIVDVVGYFRPSPPPPAPEVVAAPLPQGGVTDLFSATSLLYTGAHPIQTGVIAGTIVYTTATGLRGKALTRDGQPLANVTVSILSHPELGQTRTRADGVFDLVVNGGGQLVVDYGKEGFLPAQRPIQT